MHEVVVLGAGMAGAACARMLAKLGRRPLLIAPDDAVPSRGETLSRRAQPALESLGWLDLLDDSVALAAGDQYSVWGGPQLSRGLTQSGWHIDRSRLEDRMRATLGGVERMVGRARQVSQRADAVTIELDSGDVREAGFVADCTGRISVTSGAGERRRLDRLTACHSALALPDDAEAACATLVEAVPLGWWYTSTLPDRRMFVALFSDSDLMPAGIRKDPEIWARLMRETSAVSTRLSSLGVTLDGAPQGFASAASIVSPRLVEGRSVRAGDAGAALDPLGSNGLATALWSGVQAAHSIVDLIGGNGAPAARYENAFLEGILSHLETQRTMYASELRFADAAFWSRRNGSGAHARDPDVL